MNELFEALYDARRNAISSWQGYHYQGMVALMFFMEVLVRRYDISETEAEKIKLRIEWIEDFVLSENNEAKVICQVKKTLNKSNFEEVLGNFIVQFKILQATRTEWVLVYNNTNLSALNLKQNDYDQYYREHIEEKWLRQINLLIDNCGDNNYWRENLNLNNATSSCKDIRAYLRKWMDNNNLGYDEELEREEVCRLCLEQLCTRLAYTNNDFIEFNNRFRTCQIQMGDIDDICKDRIQELFNANPRRNPMLTTQDILDKLYVDIYHIMIDLESMEEQKNFIYELENVKNVLMDEKNSVACWEAALYREKEKLLEDISNYICNSCNDKGILCNSCILVY